VNATEISTKLPSERFSNCQGKIYRNMTIPVIGPWGRETNCSVFLALATYASRTSLSSLLWHQIRRWLRDKYFGIICNLGFKHSLQHKVGACWFSCGEWKKSRDIIANQWYYNSWCVLITWTKEAINEYIIRKQGKSLLTAELFVPPIRDSKLTIDLLKTKTKTLAELSQSKVQLH
jgi:hypothetical protein